MTEVLFVECAPDLLESKTLEENQTYDEGIKEEPAQHSIPDFGSFQDPLSAHLPNSSGFIASSDSPIRHEESMVFKTSRLHPFGVSLDIENEKRQWVMEQRIKVLDQLDELEEGADDSMLAERLNGLNQLLDSFRRQDYEKAKESQDIAPKLELLQRTNKEILRIYSQILSRLENEHGQDNQATNST